MKIRADHVTVLSLVVGMAGGLAFCWPTPWAYLAGLVFIQGWSFLDHIDGELARYQIKHLKQQPTLSGQYLDLLVHRWVQPFYHVGLSIALVRITDNWAWLLLGWIAGANYFGFTKSQADSLVLRSIVSRDTDIENPALPELVDLGRVDPSPAGKGASTLKRLIVMAKTIKSWFAFPGCLVLICLVVGIDAWVLNMEFPVVYGIPWSATVVYLFIQAVIAVGQNIAGTWYVATLLKKMP